ncbi:unnamed protein product [Ilex paraguariensis]|uniref:Acetylornithine transaminase n=1 Tax=Ilex paraguariensis TaxID=185542 RepID=A0ABC8TKK3_9AQUA
MLENQPSPNPARQEISSRARSSTSLLVQCGLGRTGDLWAHEAYDVFPDIMTLAKPLAGGLPIGAALVTERVAAAMEFGDHGSTFAGGPLVCNAAVAVLDKITKPGFLTSVATKGKYFKDILMQKLGGNSHVREVQCGLGRTGDLWAHEAYDVFPDIMTLAKPLAGGLPIGAALVTERVAAAMEFGDHGSTFAGGPLVCNAAVAVLDKITKPGFLTSVATKGKYFKDILMQKLGGNSHVREVRGLGLIIGIELDVSASPLVDACRQSGLLVLTAGKGNVVRLVPPLIISEQELDRATEILLKCLPVLDG